MLDASLVLEGGGMKGMYTAGVLDYFMKKQLIFSHCYGVSAGACHMSNYLSGQMGRSYRVGVNYVNDKRYCGMYSLITTGDIFGVEFSYHKIPTELDPYDYDAFERYPGKAFAVATDIVTGRPEYMELKDMHRDITAVRASSSLPLVSRNVEINGRLYLDGGISDSIPIRKAVSDGASKHVVILTKEVGYRRQPTSNMRLMRLKYRNYPKFLEDMEQRHIAYNETLDYLDELEAQGSVFVIRPQHKSSVGRIEKDAQKLRELYQEGYSDARKCYAELKEFLRGR